MWYRAVITLAYRNTGAEDVVSFPAVTSRRGEVARLDGHTRVVPKLHQSHRDVRGQHQRMLREGWRIEVTACRLRGERVNILDVPRERGV